MALGQIHHVDLIAHAAAVGGGPVVAKHLQFGAPAYGHLADEGEEKVKINVHQNQQKKYHLKTCGGHAPGEWVEN